MKHHANHPTRRKLLVSIEANRLERAALRATAMWLLALVAIAALVVLFVEA